ncbi:MAG: KpsF/GutQ family sugar-phosphate isomerase [Bacteroidia bacterium]|nr:KpsF/GutQ family sugar-phosphate isomerase [Bacteroidia bacterium]NNJ55195.1 KpsF/GutQ family sugar-phosphate isomerase [Bacteroidia bacterium]
MLSKKDILQKGIDTIELESSNLSKLAAKLTNSFVEIVEIILNSSGRVVVTGIGKSAIVGQKMVATLNSTGTPALFMHAADAIHGDLGMIQKDDVVFCISKSGNSPEIKALVPLIKSGGNTLIGIVGDLKSFLSEHSDYVLDTTVDKEACPNNLAPTTSTTAQMAMGDALAVALISCRNFEAKDFAKYHPGGALGKKLYLKLSDIAINNPCPKISYDANISDCIVQISKGRMGIVVVEKAKKIIGVITDGDLRRMLGKQKSWDGLSAQSIMTPDPKTLEGKTLAIDAVQFINEHKINHIVIADDNMLEGVVHIQDLIREGLV